MSSHVTYDFGKKPTCGQKHAVHSLSAEKKFKGFKEAALYGKAISGLQSVTCHIKSNSIIYSIYIPLKYKRLS